MAEKKDEKPIVSSLRSQYSTWSDVSVGEHQATDALPLDQILRSFKVVNGELARGEDVAGRRTGGRRGANLVFGLHGSLPSWTRSRTRAPMAGLKLHGNRQHARRELTAGCTSDDEWLLLELS